MYGDYGYGRGGIGMGIGFFICLILLAGLVFWIVRMVSHHEGGGHKETPLEVLDHRFARGEMDLESYTRSRAALKEALDKKK
jgi:putative membrane protein